MIHDEGRKPEIDRWNKRGNRRKLSTVINMFSVYLMQVESHCRWRHSKVPNIARVVTPATM